jgi:TonB family protein
MRIDQPIIRNAAVIAAMLLLVPAAARADLRLTEAEAKEAATAKPLPDYPQTARQLKVTGKVELEVTISAEGKVEDVKIVSGNPVLTRPCAKVVADWKFKPMRQEGKPARAVAPLTFEFK